MHLRITFFKLRRVPVFVAFIVIGFLGFMQRQSIAGTISEFQVPTAGSAPVAIAAGPDGNLWFAEVAGNKIARITPDGVIAEFPLPVLHSQPGIITAGPDGNLWFTEFKGDKIGRITPAGVISEFRVPTPNDLMGSITSGPDGNLWFTEITGNKIGRITPAGVISEFPIPTPDSSPAFITAGTDGNLWFTEFTGNKIGRITPDGVIAEFPLSSHNGGAFMITAGPGGNLWFTEPSAGGKATGDKVGRITPAGVISEFSTPTPESVPGFITAGPDGNIWFTEFFGNNIARITPAGVITEFSLPSSGSNAAYIMEGPDGNLWFTEAIANFTHNGTITMVTGSHIGRITTAGVIDEFPIPTAGGAPCIIVTGPDGNLWFTEYFGNSIGRLLIGNPLVATHFSISAPASSKAGKSKSFTVTAQDDSGKVVTGYTGTVHFASTDTLAALPADAKLTNGAGTFPVTFKTAGSQTLTATDTLSSSITGASNSIAVRPATATHFSVSAPASVTLAAAFKFTVTALDQFNNQATSYTGTVHFKSTDKKAKLPANSELTGGTGKFTAKLKTAGTQTIEAKDTVNVSIRGTSNAIDVE